MIPASTGISANFCKITPYPINRVYIPPVMLWYGIVCNVSKKGKLNQIAGHDAAFGACPAVCSNVSAISSGVKRETESSAGSYASRRSFVSRFRVVGM